MIRQAREGFIAMNVEHLNLLPPIGRWNDGEIRDLEDGEQQVLLYGDMLRQFQAQADIADPFALQTPSTTDAAPIGLDLTIQAEARNFDPETWANASSASPFPVAETHKWSELPPLEWLLAVPVTWGAVRFAGSFLDRLGAAAGDSLVTWIRDTSRRAKEADRDRYVTLSFELYVGRVVYGFVPVQADDDEVSVLRSALEMAGGLAEVAGAQRSGAAPAAHRIAYFFDGSQWQLGWFVTDEGVFRTKYFSDHAPDPERFLGRPLFPDDLPPTGSLGGRSPEL
jgi:hypothetical protein